MVRGYPLFSLRFCHRRLYLHAIGRERFTKEYTGQGPAGGLQLAWPANSAVSTVTCSTLRRGVGGWCEQDSLCFKVSFFSGLENVRGWLKVTPKLARPNWRLDSSACKKGKGRGTRKTGTELVVGLQCHTGQVRG